MNYKKSGDEPADHAIGRSRGGLTTKNHLVCDGKGRVLAFVVTGGQVADTSMLATTLEQISVAGAGLTPFRRSSRYESRPVARGRGQGDWSDHDEQQEASHPGAGRP